MPVGTEYRIYLFSGDKFYKAIALTKDMDDRLSFTSGHIKQLDASIEPPIDTAFFKPAIVLKDFDVNDPDTVKLYNVSFVYTVSQKCLNGTAKTTLASFRLLML